MQVLMLLLGKGGASTLASQWADTQAGSRLACESRRTQPYHTAGALQSRSPPPSCPCLQQGPTVTTYSSTACTSQLASSRPMGNHGDLLHQLLVITAACLVCCSTTADCCMLSTVSVQHSPGATHQCLRLAPQGQSQQAVWEKGQSAQGAVPPSQLPAACKQQAGAHTLSWLHDKHSPCAHTGRSMVSRASHYTVARL